MCGIAGFLVKTSWRRDELRCTAIRMAEMLSHRGPDDSGVWVEEKAGVALGFRRLAILDLSEQGHQPMASSCGRYVIIFNGEIYNFGTLRSEFQSTRFRGHSDTEVMLAVISDKGLDVALQSFNGMFAFGLWDCHHRVLHLARDRFGEKPLYYGWMGDSFLFASELKAFRAHPNFMPEISREALSLFFQYAYIPSPYSIYKGIYKLPPGSVLSINGADLDHRPQPRTYWCPRKIARKSLASPFQGDERDAIHELDSLLAQAVRLRVVADVPVGAFLSGGIDSSTVVALMQRQTNRAVRTFSIGFNETGYNEAINAKKVADHLGTNHTEMCVCPSEAMAIIPQLPSLYDEPFADSSQIPTYLVSKLARQQVTVSLSGDGGDELFGGYNRYSWGAKIWEGLRRTPVAFRSVASAAMVGISTDCWDKLLKAFCIFLPAQTQQPQIGDKIHRLAGILRSSNPQGIYERLICQWDRSEHLVQGTVYPDLTAFRFASDDGLEDFTSWMMCEDTLAYLPDDILVKLDRASMGVSLEARVPLLDPDIFSFAWQLPLSMKIRNGQGKWLLRQVLYRYVPKGLVERPKMGFGIPIGTWLRGPLRAWGEDLLDHKRLIRDGFLEPDAVREKWEDHLSGKRNWQAPLWCVLMFQSWLDRFHR